MKMCGHANAAADGDFVEALCPPEDTEKDVVELGARDEQEACLDRPVCDLDESAAFRDEAVVPGHAAELRCQDPCQPRSVNASHSKEAL